MVAFLMVIVVAPAEVLFRAKTGDWYWRARTAAKGPVALDDFRLYRGSFPITRTAGRTRILVVGGSTTFGLGLEAEQAWPRRLAERLERTHPSRFEVVDVSYLGGHLEGFISDFSHVSRRYIPRDRWLEGERPAGADLASWGWEQLDPDVVIVAPIVNDTAPDYVYLRRNGAEATWHARVDAFLESTPGVRLLAIAHYARLALRTHDRSEQRFDERAALARIRDSYQSSLRRFVSLWNRPRSVIVVGLPWLFNAGDGPAQVGVAMDVWAVRDRAELLDEVAYLPKLETVEQGVRAAIGGGKVSAIEVAGAIKSKPFSQRLRLYLDPVHGNAEGHDRFASDIHDAVVKVAQ